MSVAAPSGPVPAAGTGAALSGRAVPAAGAAGFTLTMLFVTVEYIRPQDWVGALAQLPLSTVLAIPLGLVLAQALHARTLRDPLVVVLALLTAFCLLWTPFATNRFWAFQSFKFMAFEMLAVVAIATFIDRPARLRSLGLLLLAGFALQGIWALGHGGRGLAIHFGDENDLALGMNVGLPFAVIGAFAARRWWLRLVLFATSGLFVAAVVASESRGGIVSLAATAAAVFCFARRKLLIALALAAGALGMFVFASDAYWADMNTMFDSEDATRVERIRSWEQAQAAWRDNPLLGVGPGNIPWVLAKYENFDTRISRSLGGRAVHSLYLTVLAEFGLVGVALYGAALVLLLARCLAIARGPDAADLHAHAWARAIACSAAAWLAGGVFLSVLYYPHLYFLMALAIATRSLQEGLGAPVAAAPRRPWATPLRVSTT